MTSFEDLPSGDKFSTKSGQFVKISDERAIGFNLGDFMDCKGSYFNEVIPCGKASYLELVALAHCTEVQALIEEEEDMTEEVQVDEPTLAIGGIACGLRTGCTEPGEVVGVTTAMAFCMAKGINSEEEAMTKFKKWTDLYPDWTQGIVITLFFPEPVNPYTLEDVLAAGHSEEDYHNARKAHLIAFPEEDIKVLE